MRFQKVVSLNNSELVAYTRAVRRGMWRCLYCRSQRWRSREASGRKVKSPRADRPFSPARRRIVRAATCAASA